MSSLSNLVVWPVTCPLPAHFVQPRHSGRIPLKSSLGERINAVVIRPLTYPPSLGNPVDAGFRTSGQCDRLGEHAVFTAGIFSVDDQMCTGCPKVLAHLRRR